MYNYCTYFDSHYIHRGLVLYDSLVKVCPNDFTLYVMAFDDDSYNYLKKLALSNMVVEDLKNFETLAMLKAKRNRTRVEYCWTCGPTVTYHFLTDYNLPDITYIDSDLYFYQNPKVIYDEIGDNSVAITEHMSAKSPRQGIYCVQYMYFKNDEAGRDVLRWWRDSCIIWCYSISENGKYADQKYLESFFSLTDKIIVLKNRGVCVANWNIDQYDFDGGNITFKGEKWPIIVMHYHGVQFNINDTELLVRPNTGYIVRSAVYLYESYAHAIMDAYNKYLGKKLTTVRFTNYSKVKVLKSNFKHLFSGSKLAQFLYYKVLKKRYDGFEGKQI